ncbi:hypothetical protein AGOR_G00166020 [Albula goreensis]|uniref:Ricin B lectin domain-containing protein n=1 Tax=Albula goreensis TaxID=1534307 RepID=A0A8T3D242_9TELE|nr:hypothetical protein AGOR_G00166020 [Albula goreensis]
MSHMWIVLCLLVKGVSGFMIYNTVHGLCLQGSRESESVLLKPCDLGSDLQQWFWENGRFLVNGGTAKCLSNHKMDAILTASCNASDALWWDCHSHRLISHNSILQLTTNGKDLFLSQHNKLSKWRALVEGDICQKTLRSKRSSDGLNVIPTEEPDYDYEEEETLTEQQKYLKWYYRTEDPSPWKYAMLALSSGALMLGCLLFGMGSMANWNRKKISQYKAAAEAQAARAEELQNMAVFKQASDAPSKHSPHDNKSTPDNCETGELRAGDIVLKWKDGNVSKLFADSPEDDV